MTKDLTDSSIIRNTYIQYDFQEIYVNYKLFIDIYLFIPYIFNIYLFVLSLCMLFIPLLVRLCLVMSENTVHCPQDTYILPHACLVYNRPNYIIPFILHFFTFIGLPQIHTPGPAISTGNQRVILCWVYITLNIKMSFT